jgi:hypothetical protein
MLAAAADLAATVRPRSLPQAGWVEVVLAVTTASKLARLRPARQIQAAVAAGPHSLVDSLFPAGRAAAA